jgi:hypothetical protein
MEDEEKWESRPYTEQELLSFDRLKRAVTNRVLDRAEAMMDVEFPLKPTTQNTITEEEWKRAKDAVKNSPLAREAYRKYLEKFVNEKVDTLIKTDREELGSMGVAEKSI